MISIAFPLVILYPKFLICQGVGANVKGPYSHFKKDVKVILKVIGLPENIKELIKLSKYREYLWLEYTKVSLKRIVKRDIILLEKSTRKQEMNGTYTTHQVLILCDQDFAKIRTKIKFLGIFSRDEEFYIPYGLEVKDTGSLFLMAYSWIGYYNTRRAHTGGNLDGKTPIEYAKEVMPELSRDIALFPLVILDNLTTSFNWKSVNKVHTHYSPN